MKRVYLSIFLLAFPTLTWAETNRKWMLGVHPGLSLPMVETNDLLTESFFLQVSVERMVAKKAALGLEYGTAFGHTFDGQQPIDIDGDGLKSTIQFKSNEQLKIHQITPYIKLGREHDWGTWGVRWVRQYVLFGAGVYHSQHDAGLFSLQGRASGGTNLNGTTQPLARRSSNNFGINVGYGLESRIWDRYRVGFDLRYHRIFRSPADEEFFIPSLRVGILF